MRIQPSQKLTSMLNKRQVDKTDIFFRVEAAPELGIGHLMRCFALAEKLQDSTFVSDIIFITASNDVADRVKSYGYGLIGLPLSISMIEEIKYYERFIKRAICITDIPDIPEKYIKALKENCCSVVSVDDSSKTLFYSDILINPNLNPSTQHAYSSRTQYYSGAKYVILKKAFEKYEEQKKRINEKADSIFVCFGGGDKNNITQIILNLIKDIGLNITVVIGGLYPYRDELIKSVDEYKNIDIIINANNMDELIDEADLAIISGGTLLYETCTVGTPAIVVCQNQDQSIESDFFAQKDAAINLGVFDKINKESVQNAVIKLITDYDRRMHLSKNAKQLIDAKGVDRIINIILKEYLETCLQ